MATEPKSSRENKTCWRQRLAWFVGLYAGSAAVAIAVAYGLRALLLH